MIAFTNRPNRLPCVASFIFSFAWIAATASCLTGCPLCDTLASTISDDIRDARLVVIAEAIEQDSAASEEAPYYARFKVLEVLKFDRLDSSDSSSLDRWQWAYSNDTLTNRQICLLMSYQEDTIQWNLPLPLSSEAMKYLRGLVRLPEEGSSRLEYFLPYLSSRDTLIAEDAYNEFAKRPMKEISHIRKQLDRNRLIGMLQAPETKPRLRGLAWMLLSLCGRPSDAELFDQALAKRDLQSESLDIDLAASMACYIVLRGEKGLRRIEQDFLADHKVSTSNAHAAISAIRVVGHEFDDIPKDRLSKSFHAVLSRSDLADFVIPDLARWQDWTAFDKLESLFFEADEESTFVRIPIINYMRLCPHPNAAAVLQRMEQADPNAARRAAMMSGRYDN